MNVTLFRHILYEPPGAITSYKDSVVAILHIQNSIILIQTTEYNTFVPGHSEACC